MILGSKKFVESQCSNYCFQSTHTIDKHQHNFIDKTEYYCWYAVNTLKISIFNALSIGSATMAAV